MQDFCGYESNTPLSRRLEWRNGQRCCKSRISWRLDLLSELKTSPFEVVIATRDISKGEELCVSYGYDYWSRKALKSSDTSTRTLPDEEVLAQLAVQETQTVNEIDHIMEFANDKYKESAWAVGAIFDFGMNSREPP